MKPKNKFQQKVIEASKKLPPLTAAQIRWANTKVLNAVGRRTTKGDITCLDCGSTIPPNKNGVFARIAGQN